VDLWLSDGWDQIRRAGWRHPLYWHLVDGRWLEFTLGGLRPLSPAAPVAHVSYYDADSFDFPAVIHPPLHTKSGS